MIISPAPFAEGFQNGQAHVPALFRVELAAHHIAPGHGGGELGPVLCGGDDGISAVGGIVGVDEVDAVPPPPRPAGVAHAPGKWRAFHPMWGIL